MYQVGRYFQLGYSMPVMLTMKADEHTASFLRSQGIKKPSFAMMITNNQIVQYIRTYMYPAMPSDFLLYLTAEGVARLYPDFEEAYRRVYDPDENVPVVYINVDTDLIFAFIVDNILTRFRDWRDKALNDEIMYVPNGAIYETKTTEAETMIHVQDWLGKLIDMNDLDLMVRSAIKTPNLTDTLLSSYNKYCDLFGDVTTPDSGDDDFAIGHN